LLGWGGATTDAIFTLQPVLHSRTVEDGIYNWGQVKDAKFDALIQAARGEIDVPKRQGLIIEAMKYHADNMFHIPLHRQVIPWAARANLSVVHRADNWLEVVWVSVK
ncbi:MAG: ABC transporter substrate-binding protein, partial [Betaproteobacteria bacterium]|nr:ABC transporter substrate-binding protein [Betaproteobacteria bacterium]